MNNNNKGRGNSRWQPKHGVDSSPNHHHTPVGPSVSSAGSVSSASGEKPHSSGNAVEEHSSGRSNYQIETPTGPQGRGRGWSTCSSGSSRGGSTVQWTESHSSGKAVEHSSGGGWSAFSSGSIGRSSLEGSTGQSTKSSKGSNVSGIHRDAHFGLNSGEKGANKQSSDTVKACRKGDSESSPINHNGGTYMESLVCQMDAAQLSGESKTVKSCFESKTPESSASTPENDKYERPILKFDLCPPRKSSQNVLKPNLFAQNREKRKENERTLSRSKGEILRPGMVLLKNYLSTSEQGSILNICRHHGLETVGFEQPDFGKEGKMHLKLMCYGMSWDWMTNQYESVRSKDGAKPPPIHQKFLELVDRAIKDSQSLISEKSRVKNVESVLPSVKPDICLVNYYSNTGRLGLHQDKDESKESLSKGIPIVSFSIGDSAEFLYSDQRDVDKADKILLESGDVLIFGGKARHIFHGVSKILPGTASKVLIEETNFRSGRLNLTFRQRF